MSLTARVSQTYSGVTYTDERTVPRSDLIAGALAGAAEVAGEMNVGKPGSLVLLLPVG